MMMKSDLKLVNIHWTMSPSLQMQNPTLPLTTAVQQQISIILIQF